MLTRKLIDTYICDVCGKQLTTETNIPRDGMIPNADNLPDEKHGHWGILKNNSGDEILSCDDHKITIEKFPWLKA